MIQTLTSRSEYLLQTVRFWAMVGSAFGMFASPVILSLFPLPIGVYVWAYLYMALSAVLAWLFLLELRHPKRLFSMFTFPRGIEREVPGVVLELASEAGVKIKKYLVVEGMLNAAAKQGGTLVVGDRLFKDLQPHHAKAVLAHEIGHHKDFKRGLVVWRMIFTFAFLMAFLIAMPVHHPWVIISGSISAAMLALWITGWKAEQNADDWAAKVVGARIVAEAFEVIQCLRPHTRIHSLGHPSMPHRIRRLLGKELPRSPIW